VIINAGQVSRHAIIYSQLKLRGFPDRFYMQAIGANGALIQNIQLSADQKANQIQ
jgi:hypothetical protein